MNRRGHWPGAKSVAVGNVADAHALQHARMSVEEVESADVGNLGRGQSEHSSGGRCNEADMASEQRRSVWPLGSSFRGVVDEDSQLGLATFQQGQSQQLQLGLQSSAADRSASAEGEA